MDDAERAELHEQMFRDIALGQKKPAPQSCGFCFYCNEKLGRGLIFCDKFCSDDWHNEQRIKQIIGRTQGHA